MTQAVTDRLAIYQTIRDDQRAEDHPTLRPSEQSVTVHHYSGGWAVMRGGDVIYSSPYLSVAEAVRLCVQDGVYCPYLHRSDAA